MYWVYIMTNVMNSVLYIGVTNDIRRRTYEHINGKTQGFTKDYRLHKLVYIESYVHPDSAIQREKQLKGWTRKKKIDLIESKNPNWENILGRI